MKFIDFKKDNKRRQTFTGTVYYIPPEIISEGTLRTPGTDFWSFGVMLYKLATQNFPFEAENEYLIMEKIKEGEFFLSGDLDNELKNLILSFLKTNPKLKNIFDT